MFKQQVTSYFESMFYHPRWYHWFTSALLLPLSIIYGISMSIRRKTATRVRYDVPIISIGNLVIGGSGKTPFTIALAEYLKDKRVTIISRGYGRRSSGLVEVSRDGQVLCSVEDSGDEPMLMASALSHASMIVSEYRGLAINLAIDNDTEVILLDDGFNRVEIEKYEILLEPKVLTNMLTLPSGPFREFRSSSKYADLHLREDEDFSRVVTYENLSKKMVLVTAIADPSRLDAYLPDGVVTKVYLEDHAYFCEEELQEMLAKYSADSVLTTEKDYVKMAGFKLHISLMKLKLQIDSAVFAQIDNYIKDHRDT